jgi:phosphopantetheine--protein transferase-like protein
MIGVDIEDISRFEGRELDEKFLNRIFTPSEIEYCLSFKNSAEHLCGRFCVKESVIKVLSYIGIRILKYNSIEVYNGEYGEPHVRILEESLSHIKIDVSISHDKTKSIAVAMIDNNSIEKVKYKPCCMGDEG